MDILAVIATAIGVATSLGFGALQIGAGLHHVFGVPRTAATQLSIIGAAMVLYLLSSTTGLHRGIKWLSNLNMVLAGTVLLAFLCFGPTGFLFEDFTHTLGGYLNQLPAMSLHMTLFTESTWVADWTIFYWAWWISWAPFVGSFIAAVSRGRTVRQFVVGVLAVPTLVSFVWFSALGGTALHLQMFDGVDLVAALQQAPEQVLFQVLDFLPGAGFLALLTTLLLLTFFITSADSATLVLAMMTSGGMQEPPMWKKLAWGVLMAAVAAVLVIAGGLQGLQSMAVIAAVPFAVILVLVCFSLIRALREEEDRFESEELAFRHALRRWLANENRQGTDTPVGKAE